jgi:hypothetical protein
VHLAGTAFEGREGHVAKAAADHPELIACHHLLLQFDRTRGLVFA